MKHEDDDSRPTRLEELTTDFRLQQRQLQRQGWRRNLLFAAGAVVALVVIYLLARR